MYASEQIFRVRRHGRTQSTAARIEAKFRDLLAARALHQISVADLADGCGIARSTFYRLYADPVETLWAIALPVFEDALAHALRGHSQGFVESLGRLWDTAGLVAAVNHPKANARIRAKLTVIVQARLRQHACGSGSETCALVMVAACLTVLAQNEGCDRPPESELGELMSLIYIAAYLTPGALQSIAREQARRGMQGGFPAAVSVEESLAHPPHRPLRDDAGRIPKLLRTGRGLSDGRSRIFGTAPRACDQRGLRQPPRRGARRCLNPAKAAISRCCSAATTFGQK